MPSLVQASYIRVCVSIYIYMYVRIYVYCILYIIYLYISNKIYLWLMGISLFEYGWLDTFGTHRRNSQCPEYLARGSMWTVKAFDVLFSFQFSCVFIWQLSWLLNCECCMEKFNSHTYTHTRTHVHTYIETLCWVADWHNCVPTDELATWQSFFTTPLAHTHTHNSPQHLQQTHPKQQQQQQWEEEEDWQLCLTLDKNRLALKRQMLEMYATKASMRHATWMLWVTSYSV